MRRLRRGTSNKVEVTPPTPTAPIGSITFTTLVKTHTQITQSFTYSAADATGFEYQVDTGSIFSLASSPVSLSGLTASTSYLIKVRATNAVGPGTWFSTNVTTNATPVAPTGNISFGAATITASTISQPFTYSAGDATSFDYRVNGGTPVTGISSPVALTGLSPSTAYTIEVRAVNVAGTSAWFSVIDTTSAVALPPQGTITFGSPTTSATTISLPFTYSLSDQTGFKYRVNGGSWNALAASPVSLTGLTPSTAYNIDVLATNANGDGTVFSASTITTLAGVAPAGTITFGSETVTSTTASVPFTYDLADHTGFEYKVDAGSYVATTSPVSLTGLTASTAYTVYVRAINAYGNGTAFTKTITTASALSPDNLMQTALWTGNGTSKDVTITNFNLGADVVAGFVRQRSGSIPLPAGVDSLLGTSGFLNQPGTTGLVTTATAVTALLSNGIRFGSHASVNANAQTFCGHFFKQYPGFFDIVQYTGNATLRTITHGIGAVPGMIIIRHHGSSFSPIFWHKGLGSNKYQVHYANFSGPVTDATIWNNTLPGVSSFTLGAANSWNTNGANFTAYIFADNIGSPPFNFIRCGTYTGTGAAGNNVNLGFTNGVKYLWIKRIDGSGDTQRVVDATRGINSGVEPTFTDQSSAEASENIVEFLSTGFSITGSNSAWNASGGTYVYLAVAAV